MLVSRQLSYSVLKPFRYSGRGYEPGDVFNARRADPRMGRLRQWCAEGVLGPLSEKPKPESEDRKPSESQLAALESLAEANGASDPEGEQLEDLPDEDEDFEE
jgi:hypothetical protein